MRVEAARQLLVGRRMPVKRVAERCGFGSEETMRRSFLRQIGTNATGLPLTLRRNAGLGHRDALRSADGSFMDSAKRTMPSVSAAS